LTVTFTDTSTDGTTPGSGTITNRYWIFGDGGTSNTTATTLSHTYSSTGTNTVTLIVSDSIGMSATNTQTDLVVVTAKPPPPVPHYSGSGVSVNPGTGQPTIKVGSTSADYEYSIEWTADLISDTWHPLNGSEVWTQGNGGILPFTDTEASGSTQRFYRILVR
jgi:PKD repeat protein